MKLLLTINKCIYTLIRHSTQKSHRPYALREKTDNSSAFVHHIGNVDEEEHLLLLEVNQLVDVLFCFIKFECAQFGDTKFCLDYYELG